MAGNKDAVTAVPDAFVGLYDSDNWDGLGALYHEDAFLQPADQQQSRGRAGAVAAYKAAKASGLRSLKRGDTHVEFLSDNFCAALIKWNYTKPDGSAATLKDMTVFKLVDGKWLIYMQTFNFP